MTTRTAEVSVEASETGRQAAEVRENAAGLSNAMEELRHSVIRVVRTSTPEVDRRGTMRHAVDLPCRMMIEGQAYSARVTMSDTGAQVRGAPELPAGLGGTLSIDRVGFPLSFTVKRSEANALGLEFALDKATGTKFSETLRGLIQRRAA